MSRIKWNWLTLAAALLFYLFNRFCLIPGTTGVIHWFLRCYANDLWAGAVMLAWFDLLLHWARLPALNAWKASISLLLGCGLFWEFLSPLWNPQAVCDPWDLLAYELGGILWLYLMKRNTARLP